MIAIVALSAPDVPPETGASTKAMPASAKCAAIAWAACGPMVEVSMTDLTLRLGAAASSRATARDTLPSGRERMTVSALWAISALDVAILAPSGARSVLTASAITSG
jgi:hypothetical protein